MTDDIENPPAPEMPEGEQVTFPAPGVAADPTGAEESLAPTPTPVEVPAEAAAEPAEVAAAPAEVAAEAEVLAAAPAEVAAEAPAPAPGEDLPEGRLSAEDFAAAVERTVVEFSEGSLVSGTVVRVDPDEVLVDIGFKSEGIIPINELSIRNNVNPNEVVQVGERIEAMVLQIEDQEGRLILSKKRAQYERAWGRIEEVMRQAGTVTGQVIEVVKGGLIVDIGLRGFLPASLV